MTAAPLAQRLHPDPQIIGRFLFGHQFFGQAWIITCCVSSSLGVILNAAWVSNTSKIGSVLRVI
jgi:hypothetical protein